MHLETVEICWHGKEPVLSVDWSDTRMATAGADTDIKVWKVRIKDGVNIQVDFMSNLTQHTKSVNVVRFSPNGHYLASAGDDGRIYIWYLSDKPADTSVVFGSEDAIPNLETWLVYQTFRTHTDDIFDLAWSCDSQFIASVSVDRSLHIHYIHPRNSISAVTGPTPGIQPYLYSYAGSQTIQKIKEHTHFVQGVAWDPRGLFLATQSSDRTLRVYTSNKYKLTKSKIRPKKTSILKDTPSETNEIQISDNLEEVPITPKRIAFKCTYINSKLNEKPQIVNSTDAVSTQYKYFHDETLPSFFRRPAFSPDGNYLVVPTGIYMNEASIPTSVVTNTTFLYHRNDLSRPILHFPSIGKPSVVVRFNPFLYKLHEGDHTGHGNNTGVNDLYYRMIFAVATLDSVILYDTQQLTPFAYISNIHFAPITDIAWKPDGRALSISSQDGYCSILAFNQEELGQTLEYKDYPNYNQQDLLKYTSTEANRRIKRVAPQLINNLNDSDKLYPSLSTVPSEEINKPVKLLTPRRKIKPTLIECPVEISTPVIIPATKINDIIEQEVPQEPPKKKKRISPTLITSLPT